MEQIYLFLHFIFPQQFNIIKMHSADLFSASRRRPAVSARRLPPSIATAPADTLRSGQGAFILREAVRAYLKTRSNTDGPFKHIICNSSDSLNCDHYLPEGTHQSRGLRRVRLPLQGSPSRLPSQRLRLHTRPLSSSFHRPHRR